MLLSIIVPVYNAKKELSRCLDSIRKQSISDMEIICVDDGSTDGTGELLDQYAGFDSRIKVIHKPNEGLVRARKSGIEFAAGKYTGYVDADDWIEPEMYQVLCNVAEEYKVDMVSSGYILEKGAQVEFYDGFPEGLYQGETLEELRKQIFFCEKDKEAGIRPSLCDKLFRTSVLRGVQWNVPDEVSNCEDRLCTVAFMLEAKSVYILKKAFYHYVFHKNSMSHREDAYYLDKLGNVYRAFQSLYCHPDFSERLRVQCELYMVKMAIAGLNEYMGFSVPDLMWIPPKWIGHFPEKAKIVLYGAGRLGKVYYRQMISDHTKNLQLITWVDRNYQNLMGYPQQIDNPEQIKYLEYDYILLALADRQPAEIAKKQLICELGVDRKKIIWLEHEEIFWEYAEAAGVLGGQVWIWN